MIQYFKFALFVFALLFGQYSYADFREGFNAYVHKDYDSALKVWLPLANSGDTEAQCWLGHMYNQGKGVEKSGKTAVQWYLKSANLGSVCGAQGLGLAYRDGDGGAKDEVAAVQWFLKVKEMAGNDPKYLQAVDTADSNIKHLYEKNSSLESAVKKASMSAKTNIELSQSEKKKKHQDAAFQKALKEGDDTNCGMVIEKKARLVKIQLASSNNEQWIKIDDVLPPGRVCPMAKPAHQPQASTDDGDCPNAAQKTGMERVNNESIQTCHKYNGRWDAANMRCVHGSGANTVALPRWWDTSDCANIKLMSKNIYGITVILNTVYKSGSTAY